MGLRNNTEETYEEKQTKHTIKTPYGFLFEKLLSTLCFYVHIHIGTSSNRQNMNIRLAATAIIIFLLPPLPPIPAAPPSPPTPPHPHHQSAGYSSKSSAVSVVGCLVYPSYPRAQQTGNNKWTEKGMFTGCVWRGGGGGGGGGGERVCLLGRADTKARGDG